MEHFQPRWPWVLFGDGDFAQLRRWFQKEDKNGVNGCAIIMRPSEEIITKYTLRRGEDIDESGLICCWYPEVDVKILSNDPISGRVLVFCNFKGQPTGLSRTHYDMATQLKSQQKMIKTLESGKAYLEQQLRQAMSNEEQRALAHKRIIDAYTPKRTKQGDDDEYDESGE